MTATTFQQPFVVGAPAESGVMWAIRDTLAMTGRNLTTIRRVPQLLVFSLIQALRALDDKGITLTDAGLRRPTLDDVFLTLTGHRAEEVAS